MSAVSCAPDTPADQEPKDTQAAADCDASAPSAPDANTPAAEVRISDSLSTLAVGDVTGDGADDLVVGDPYGDAALLFAGPLSSELSEADAESLGSAVSDSYFGTLVAVADIVGSGTDDVVVTGYSSLEVFDGPVANSRHPVVTMSGIDEPMAVSLGDVDGDGVADLLVGQLGSVSGSSSAEGDLDSSQASIQVDAPPNFTGGWMAPIATGDIDGDGVGDLVVAEGPQVALFFGPLQGTVPADAAQILNNGPGASSVLLGDLDGDGTSDLLVGSRGQSTIYVWTAPVAGGTEPSASFAHISDPPESTEFGSDIAVTRSGNASVVALGDELADHDAGRVWLGRGPFCGAVDIDTAGSWVWPASGDSSFGSPLRFGDLTGDGEPDLVAGSMAERNSDGIVRILAGPF